MPNTGYHAVLLLQGCTKGTRDVQPLPSSCSYPTGVCQDLLSAFAVCHAASNCASLLSPFLVISKKVLRVKSQGPLAADDECGRGNTHEPDPKNNHHHYTPSAVHLAGGSAGERATGFLQTLMTCEDNVVCVIARSCSHCTCHLTPFFWMVPLSSALQPL